MSIKIALYEDNKTYRESLSMYLSMNPKFEVVGSFKNANNIENELKEFEPEVILMDIDMPGINGIHAVKKIRSYNTRTHVIMLTVFETNELIFDALCAGANGYLLKNTAPEKIADAILEVYVGGAPMTTSIARKVLLYFSNRNVQTDFSLTQRE